MKISKKNLISLLKQNIREMAMDFDPEDESRPHPSLQGKLERGETPLSKIPFPKTGREPAQNFQELLASDRYKQVIEKIRRYTHYTGAIKPGGIGPLVSMMFNAHSRIIEIEHRYKSQLEELAVELVKREFKLPDNAFQFDAKIIGMNEFDTSDFKRDVGNQQNAVQVEADLASQLESLDLEKAKRRLINSIIQGSSERGHYMYHYVEPELRQLTGSNELMDLYGVLMSTLDAQYWQFSPEQISGMAGDSVAGKAKPTNRTDPPTIYARGINFPVLVHELIKGIMEAFATKGRSEDYEDVEESEDTLDKETWDILLGPAIWDRLRARIPEEVLLDNDTDIQNYLYMLIFELPARQFLVFMKEILSGTPTGDNMMNELVNGAKELLNGRDYQHNIEKINKKLNIADENTSDDEIANFIQSLNIPESENMPDLDDEDAINRFLDQLNREE